MKPNEDKDPHCRDCSIPCCAERVAALMEERDGLMRVIEQANEAWDKQIAMLREALQEAMYANSTALSIRLAEEALEATK